MGNLPSLSSLSLLSVFFCIATLPPPDRNPIIHFPAQPSKLSLWRKKKSDPQKSSTLQALVAEKCQSLFTPFNSTWWLSNGHLQTFYCALGSFENVDQMWYNRKCIRLTDGGTLGLDFAPADSSKVRDDAPIIVIQHGLTGGSYEAYIRAVLVRACAPVEEGGLGYRAVVVNFRGCAGVPITSSQLYSAGATDDLRQGIMYIAKCYPNAPLLGLSFSLGANVMTRYLAEEGKHCRLLSGCALACPWNLYDNNTGLLSSFIGRRYAKVLGTNLLNLIKRHLGALTKDPEHRVTKAVPSALALKNPTLREFDHTFTRIAGGRPPTFPFDSAEDYYLWGSSDKVVKDVTVPFLAINAQDDPIVRYVPMDAGGNRQAIMVLTKGGGHLGWFQDSQRRWTTQPVLEWLRMTAESFDRESLIEPRRLYTDGEGWIRVEGNDELGCQETEGGGIINGNGGEDGILQGF